MEAQVDLSLIALTVSLPVQSEDMSPPPMKNNSYIVYIRRKNIFPNGNVMCKCFIYKNCFIPFSHSSAVLQNLVSGVGLLSSSTFDLYDTWA